jgi:hypothetical protein
MYNLKHRKCSPNSPLVSSRKASLVVINVSVWGAEFLVLFFSPSLQIFINENIIFFHPISLFEQKKVSFNDSFMITLLQENKSERKKEPQILQHLTQHSQFESSESDNFIENPI